MNTEVRGAQNSRWRSPGNKKKLLGRLSWLCRGKSPNEEEFIVDSLALRGVHNDLARLPGVGMINKSCINRTELEPSLLEDDLAWGGPRISAGPTRVRSSLAPRIAWVDPESTLTIIDLKLSPDKPCTAYVMHEEVFACMAEMVECNTPPRA